MASQKSRPPAAVHGRRELKKSLTRRELLAAGRTLFAEKGLYESRIEDLSRGAGIAKGTLYGYFASKEALIEAVVTEGFDALFARVEAAAAGARSREAGVDAVTAAHLEFFRESPDLMRVFHQVRGLLKFRGDQLPRLRRVLADHVVRLAGVLARASGRGARTEADRELAATIFGAVSGMVSVRASLGRRTIAAPKPDATRRAIVGLAREFESPARAPRRRARRA